MLAILLCITFLLTGCGKKKGSADSPVESADSPVESVDSSIESADELGESVDDSVEPEIQSFRICFDEADCTVSDLEYNAYNGMLKYAYATGTDGKSIKVYFSDVYVEDGMIYMFPSAYITNAIGLPGIDHIEFEGLSTWAAGTVNYVLTDDYAQITNKGIKATGSFPMSGITTAPFETDPKQITQVDLDSNSYPYFAVGVADEEAMWMCHSIIVYYKDGDFVETATSDRTPNKYMTVSAYGDNVAELEMNGNYVKSLVTYDQDGNLVEWLCKDLEVQSDGRFCLHEGGYLFNKTPIQGLCNVSYTGNENQGNGDYYHMQAGLIAYTENIQTIDDVLWGLASYAYEDMPFNDLMGYLSYYCMDTRFGDITFESFVLGYMDEGFTGLSKAILNTEVYGNYVEGQLYDPTREHCEVYDECFNVVVIPDSDEADVDNGSCSYFIPMERITVGDLYDVSGNVKSKDEPLCIGDQLMITIAGCDLMMRLPVYPVARPYNNFREARGNGAIDSVGEKNILVIPIYLSNQEDRATQDGIEGIQIACGRVIDRNGNITDYSGERYSLSQYYDIASYGKLKLNSFITDWYCVEGMEFDPESSEILWDEYLMDLIRRVNADYADMASILDRDGDDIFDGVIIVCAYSGNPGAVVQSPMSLAGSYENSMVYDSDTMRDDGMLNVTAYCYINESYIYDNVEKRDPSGVYAETMIHEFAHCLGPNDYYDLSGSGIDAVGGYDMQSMNVGDWNPYSKYAVGWITPTIVNAQNMESDSITVSIRPFATSGDFIIIPTQNTRYNDDGTISPFSEYLLIDYFTPEGVNDQYAKVYNLDRVHGIRIYHVSANMIDIPLIDTAGLLHVRHENGETGDYCSAYFDIIGAEYYFNTYNDAGCYNLQVIQKGGRNTLTAPSRANGNTWITANDFFYTGDTFQIKNYTEFFGSGVMNDGSEFPYTITVESINDTEAVIEIHK